MIVCETMEQFHDKRTVHGVCLPLPSQLAECKHIGLDVSLWTKNDWVDMVIVMVPDYRNMDADVALFVELTKGTECVVISELEYYVRGCQEPKQKGMTWASLEVLRAGETASLDNVA